MLCAGEDRFERRRASNLEHVYKIKEVKEAKFQAEIEAEAGDVRGGHGSAVGSGLVV